eukprot:8742187-Karenia_brevis.AAC.1
MREAAQLTRDEVLADGSGGDFSTDSILTSISRAVFSQNWALARLLWDRHALARDHLGSFDGHLYLRNPGSFSHDVSKFRSVILGKQIDDVRQDIMLHKRSTGGDNVGERSKGLVK